MSYWKEPSESLIALKDTSIVSIECDHDYSPGYCETYEVEIVESRKKKVYVHCDPSENMTREDVVKIVENLYASKGLITVKEDDSIFDVTVR